MRTTKNIVSSILSSLVNELKKVMPLFKESDAFDKTVEQGISVAVAPEVKQLERLGIEATKQGCPLTASSKEDSSIGALEDFGNLYLEREPDKAVGGRYSATFTGIGGAPAGTQYVQQDTGFVFILESNVAAAGEGIIQSVGNDGETLLNIGIELFSQQTTELDEIITISEILTYPQDSETTENYRDEVVERVRVTPHGGSKGDYVRWLKEVDGIYKVFPYTLVNIASNYLMQLRTDANPTGAATTTQIESAYTALDVQDVMASGDIEVLSIVNRIYNIEIQGLTNTAKQAVAIAALKDYFDAKFPFISGIDNENTRTDRVTKAEILQTVYTAIFPDSLADCYIEVHGVEVNDEYLPNGTIGTAEVTFD